MGVMRGWVLCGWLLVGCASAPPVRTVSDAAVDGNGGVVPDAAAMQAETLRIAGQPKPACEPGHEKALAGGMLQVKAGETVCVRVQKIGDALQPVAVVAEAGEDTVIVRAWINGSNSFLRIDNPFGDTLGYQALLRRPKTMRFDYTSTCEVLSQRYSLESWPYPVGDFMLGQFRTAPDDGTVRCR